MRNDRAKLDHGDSWERDAAGAQPQGLLARPSIVRCRSTSRDESLFDSVDGARCDCGDVGCRSPHRAPTPPRSTSRVQHLHPAPRPRSRTSTRDHKHEREGVVTHTTACTGAGWRVLTADTAVGFHYRVYGHGRAPPPARPRDVPGLSAGLCQQKLSLECTTRPWKKRAGHPGA